jgi:N-acetylglutamate synthase-like GNAT family acetyltransferase
MIMASLMNNQYAAGDEAVAMAAGPVHAAAICRLIGYWSDQGLTIRRDLKSVVASIDDFAVAVYRQRVAGCGAIARIGEGLGEIRSIAVDPGARRVRAGRAVMDHLLGTAHARGIERVLLLTKTPGFFERFGFEAVETDAVPRRYAEAVLSEPARTLAGKVAMQRFIGAPVRVVAAAAV